MKKLMLAGAFSMTLAAMPILTSFASTSNVTDRLVISLYDTCAFERTSVTDPSDGGEYNNYAVSLIPGSYASGFGGSTLNVTCNTPDVYEVTAVFTDLMREGGSESIPYSTYNPDGTVSLWTTTIGNAGEAPRHVTSGDTIMVATQASGGSTTTTHYSVGAASDQVAGAYTGTATYTLVSGA